MTTPRYKPGPKSTKPINLGDSSGESSDKENSHTQITESGLEFRTPQLEEGATDYGLEFTAHQMNASPRGSSTMYPQNSDQRRTLRSRVQSASDSVSNNGVSQSESQPTNHLRTQSSGRRVKQRRPLKKDVRILKEIRDLCSRTRPLIPRLPFSRVVREIILAQSDEVTRMTRTAVEALQEATEMYVTQRLEDAYLLTLHRGLVTLQLKDLQMVNYLLDRF